MCTPLNNKCNDPIEILSPELVINILGRLDEVSLCKCEVVSKRWQEFASDHLLWKTCLKPGTLIPEGMKAKDIVAKHECIQELRVKIPLHASHGKFHVQFPKYPAYCDVEINLEWKKTDQLGKECSFVENFIYT